MAYAFQPLEAALDSLGVNYTDGVTVKIAEKYTVNCDFTEIEEILKSDPEVSSLHAEYDCAFEKKVLEDLEKYKQEKERVEEERRNRIAEFDRRKAEEAEQRRKEEEEKALEDERRRLEEIEKERETLEEEQKKIRMKEEEEENERRRELEAKEKQMEEEKSRLEEEQEWKQFEEERVRTSSISNNKDVSPSLKDIPEQTSRLPNCDNRTPLNSSDPTTAATIPAVSNSSSAAAVAAVKPGTAADQPVISQSDNGHMNKSSKPVAINFSEFEAVADVFADMELKTINDLAELQTILGGSSVPNHINQTVSGTAAHPPVSGTAAHPPYSSNLRTVIQTASYPSSQIYQGPISSQAYSSQMVTSLSQSYQPGQWSAAPSQSQGVPGQGAARLPGHLNHTPVTQSSPLPGQPGQGFGTTNPFSYMNGSSTDPRFQNYYQGYRGYPGMYPGQQFFQPNQVQGGRKEGQGAAGTVTQSVERSRSEGRSKSSDRSVVKLNSSDSSERESQSTEEAGGELKPSRSVGDIISELQKEARSIAEHKRKNVQTPPPRPGSRGQSGLEDWVPWPKIGPDDPMEGLGVDVKKMCSQLAEMGFPSSRLVKAARSYGADSQKLINYCVLVDKLVDEGFKEEDILDSVLLQQSDEANSRKHLEGFRKLSELGFESQAIHRALIESGEDHQKALEELIK